MECFPTFIAILLFYYLVFHLLRNSNPNDTAQLNNRVDQLAANRQYVEAEQILQQLVKTTERKQGKDTIEIVYYLRRTAYLKLQQGDKNGAEHLSQRVIKIQKRDIGIYSADLLPTLGQLAQISREKGDFDSAVALMRRMLAVMTAAYGEGNWRMADFYNGLDLCNTRKANRNLRSGHFARQLRSMKNFTERSVRDEVKLATSGEGLAVMQGNEGSTRERWRSWKRPMVPSIRTRQML